MFVFVCQELGYWHAFPGNGPYRVQGLLFYKIFTLYAIYAKSLTLENNEQRAMTEMDGSRR
jgi:hypothetical protein